MKALPGLLTMPNFPWGLPQPLPMARSPFQLCLALSVPAPEAGVPIPSPPSSPASCWASNLPCRQLPGQTRQTCCSLSLVLSLFLSWVDFGLLLQPFLQTHLWPHFFCSCLYPMVGPWSCFFVCFVLDCQWSLFCWPNVRWCSMGEDTPCAWVPNFPARFSLRSSQPSSFS